MLVRGPSFQPLLPLALSLLLCAVSLAVPAGALGREGPGGDRGDAIAQVATVATGTPVATPTRSSTGTPSPAIRGLDGPSAGAGSARSSAEPPARSGLAVRNGGSQRVRPQGGGDDAVAYNPNPSVIGRGDYYQVGFQNTGTTTWTTAAGYAMRNVDTNDSYNLGDPFAQGGCDGLPPSFYCLWTFALPPGAQPGVSFLFHHRMFQSTGFGETLNLPIALAADNPTRLEAVVSGVSRNPDLTFTGVDVETSELRVTNTGPFRTVASIKWYSTSFDDVASLVKTDALDLLAGAVGVLTVDAIPDGCTRCLATISTVDADGSAGSVYGLSGLRATISQRVVPAGNALATGTAPGHGELFPSGPNTPNTWVLPTVYKRGQVGGQIWSTLITGCFLPFPEQVLPRQVVLQFTGGAGGPLVVVRALNPGACLALNMATDPEVAALLDGTYAVTVTTLGGFFVSGLSYSLTGQMAQIANGTVPGAPTATPTSVGATAIPTATPVLVVTPTPSFGPISRRLEAVVSGITRNPDISYTGVYVETEELRVTNTGPLRTLAQVEWFSTSSDNVASLVKTDTIEIAGTSFPDPIHRTAVFSANIIPFGCTRCQAFIYSLDFETDGIFDLTAMVTHRVVDAGNALATGTAPLLEEIIPAGPNAPSSWALPVVYKRALVGGVGGVLWNTIINACFLRTDYVQSPRMVDFQFIGGGNPPAVVTRSASPGGCITLNLDTFDPKDFGYGDQLASLPNGIYSVRITALGGLHVSALSYTTMGQAAQLTNGIPSIPPAPTPTGVVPSVTPTPFPGLFARRLEAVVAGIARNPDTSYTGVYFQTRELRVRNTGPLRTVVQVEWRSTGSDGVASLVKTDSIEVAGSNDPDPILSTAIFPQAYVPDGCTRCQALIYSLDYDVNDPINGITDLTATVTQRVPEAANALATGPAQLIEDVIPTGPDTPSSWMLPVVYKNAPVGGAPWSTVITACFLPYPYVQAPRLVELQFTGGGKPDAIVTRFANPGGCVTLNLGTFDPKDPDFRDQLAGLPNGTYSVQITALGGLHVSALSYSTTGGAAQLTNGVPTTPITPTPTGALPSATPSTRTPTPTSGPFARRLEAVVSGISRNPDTRFTEIDVETIDIRATNTGAARTLVQVEWHSTGFDGVATLVKVDAIEIAGTADPDPIHRTAAFTRSTVPDGCTLCQAFVYSGDLDTANPLKEIARLQVTTSLRVVDAGNPMASAPVPNIDQLLPNGLDAPVTWLFPQVFKNSHDALPSRNTLLTGCSTASVFRSIQFAFTPVGSAGGLYQVTRVVNPSACLALNLSTVSMPDGEYAVTVTSPGGFHVSALTYSIQGRTAQLANAAGLPGAAPTPTPSPTRSPTATPPVVSGRGFTLQSGGLAPAGGRATPLDVPDRLLSWQPGSQGNALILRYHPTSGFDFLPSLMAPLPAGVGSYWDSEPLAESTYCYVLMAYLGSLSALDIRGLSDLLCIFTGTSGGAAPPGQLRIRLNETSTAALGWSPAGAGDGYRLIALPLTGSSSLQRVTTLPPAATFATDDTAAVPTCYTLITTLAGTSIGNSDTLCAFPGIASFPVGVSRVMGGSPLQRLAEVLTRTSSGR